MEGAVKGAVTVRRAIPDDATAIADVLRNAFREYEQLYTPEAFAATTPDTDQVLSRFREGPIWVVEMKGQIVGTASGVTNKKELAIRSVGVRPSARGRGVGTTLLAATEGYARLQHVYCGLFLTTTPFLLDAIRLYLRFGFMHTVDVPRALFGTPLIAMRKHLLDVNAGSAIPPGVSWPNLAPGETRPQP